MNSNHLADASQLPRTCRPQQRSAKCAFGNDYNQAPPGIARGEHSVELFDEAAAQVRSTCVLCLLAISHDHCGARGRGLCLSGLDQTGRFRLHPRQTLTGCGGFPFRSLPGGALIGGARLGGVRLNPSLLCRGLSLGFCLLRRDYLRVGGREPGLLESPLGD
jgi:hypothetical protein